MIKTFDPDNPPLISPMCSPGGGILINRYVYYRFTILDNKPSSVGLLLPVDLDTDT